MRSVSGTRARHPAAARPPRPRNLLARSRPPATQPTHAMLLSHIYVRSEPPRVRALTRIDDETRARHSEADAHRLSLTSEPPSAATYRQFLLRLYGFEAPVEAALQATPGIADVFDVRARFHTRL